MFAQFVFKAKQFFSYASMYLETGTPGGKVQKASTLPSQCLDNRCKPILPTQPNNLSLASSLQNVL